MYFRSVVKVLPREVELFAVLSWALAALMSSPDSSALSALGSLPLGSLLQARAPTDSPALRTCRLSAEDSFCEGSSCELNETFEEDSSEGREWRPPDSELIRRIHTQVESYLSDESLAEDAFLLKHVRRNRMGYVSIKLLTSFKKVRYLTRDWQTTLHALRFSEALVVNEEGTKVRRRKPVSESLIGIPPSKLLLAWNLPGEPQAPGSSPDPGQRNLMETAMGVFGAHGTISSLRILRPGKELPSELKRHAFKYPELSSKVCALVEYEFLDGSRKAYEGLRAQQCVAGREGIKVVLLGGRGIRKKNYVLDPEESEDLDETSESKPPKKPTRKSKRFPYALEDSSLYSSSESDFAPASPVPVRRVARPQALYGSPLASPRVAPAFRPNSFSSPLAADSLGSPVLPRKLFASGHCPSPLAAPELSSPSLVSGSSPEGSRRSVDVSSDSGILMGSPWVQRRKMAAAQAFVSEKVVLVSSLGKKAVESTVPSSALIRQPRGPDGTKGFFNCIGRGKLMLRH
ncbi:la-related protein 6-like isoform X1 [Acipenser ruthenus]|uniref:la-related protein 6-like isoform X1 n=2 Tax=Acipenser ruthenus TaxID=7906 RepID=UPI0027418EE8|nr:la-related protein 6-like isoform X1 [Acipenser ruthenus]